MSKLNIIPNKKSIYEKTTKHNNAMQFLFVKEITYFIPNSIITKLNLLNETTFLSRTKEESKRELKNNLTSTKNYLPVL